MEPVLEDELLKAKIQREKSLANLFDHLSSLVNTATGLITEALKNK